MGARVARPEALRWALGWHAQRLCDGRGFRSGAPPSDQHPTGINPRRDGDRAAIACWLRVPSDGGKPHRNEDRC
jgi:hypothetical protein